MPFSPHGLQLLSWNKKGGTNQIQLIICVAGGHWPFWIRLDLSGGVLYDRTLSREHLPASLESHESACQLTYRCCPRSRRCADANWWRDCRPVRSTSIGVPPANVHAENLLMYVHHIRQGNVADNVGRTDGMSGLQRYILFVPRRDVKAIFENRNLLKCKTVENSPTTNGRRRSPTWLGNENDFFAVVNIIRDFNKSWRK